MIYKHGEIEVRSFEGNDYRRIKNIRAIDREDIKVLFDLLPEQSLSQSVKVSTHVFTILKNEEIIAILGLMPETLISNKALVWMITTDEIQCVPISFLRGSRVFVQHLFTLYGSLYGTVRNENICSFKWLKWMGANMVPNKTFHSFTLERS